MYNKSEIMKAAWVKFNANKGRKVTAQVRIGNTGNCFRQIRVAYTFSMALTAAWREAKAAVKAAAAQAAMTVEERIEAIKRNLFNLNMKDRFDSRDRAQMDAWRTELAQLVA